jgi:hypothetical protein
MAQVTLSGAGTSVDLTAPMFGYTTSIDLPFDIVSLENRQLGIYDPGIAYDKRSCRCTFELTATEQAALNAFVLATRGQDVILTLSTPKGFKPFGADKGDTGPFTISFNITAQKGIGENPFLYFHTECLLINTGSWPSYSLPSEVNEGSFTIGSISNIRFPENWFESNTTYAIDVQQNEGGSVNYMDKSTHGDSYGTAFELSLGEGKCAALLSYLTGTARGTVFTTAPPSNSYMFGRDKGSNGLYSVQLQQNVLEIRHNKYNEHKLSLSLNYAS